MIPPIGSELHSPKPEGAKVEKAAQEFESLWIEQMLKSMHAGESGESNAGGENETLLELSQQQLARLLSQNGGFGLARMIRKSMEQKD